MWVLSDEVTLIRDGRKQASWPRYGVYARKRFVTVAEFRGLLKAFRKIWRTFGSKAQHKAAAVKRSPRKKGSGTHLILFRVMNYVAGPVNTRL